VAGNKNPWRDIPSLLEWLRIELAMAPSTPRTPSVPTPPLLFELARRIQFGIRQYHAIAKDHYTLFGQRISELDSIANLAGTCVEEYRRVNLPGAKSPGGKVPADQRDVWAASLAHRAAKKAGYLTTMAQWHQTAKAKYRSRVPISLFLRRLAEGGHVKGEKLHATPYATIEKIDPYHRQTFVTLDPDDATTGSDEHRNLMGCEFLNYLAGHRFPGASNPDPSFYEWLEYSPFCIGTPGFWGDDAFRNPRTISLAGHDLTHVLVTPSKLVAEQVISAPGVWTTLNTSLLPASNKGPPGAAAFVWDADCNLYLHSHGLDGFVHTSAKQGKKIRCSGMLVAVNGIVTYMSNQSGHYEPNAESIYNFGKWLHARRCVLSQAIVEITRGTGPLRGRIQFPAFLDFCRGRGFPGPVGLSYPQ